MPSSDDPPHMEASVRQQIEQSTWWALQDDPDADYIAAIIEVDATRNYSRPQTYGPPAPPPIIFAEPTPMKRIYLNAQWGDEHLMTSLMSRFDRMTNAEFQQLIREGKLIPLAPRPMA